MPDASGFELGRFNGLLRQKDKQEALQEAQGQPIARGAQALQVTRLSRSIPRFLMTAFTPHADSI